MTYLPWNIPLFQKMIFHFLKREPLLSINHKMQSWEERGFYIPNIIYKLDGKLVCECLCLCDNQFH